MKPPLVLKLGGSLAESGRLAHILAVVAKTSVPLVVVPGGGPFADTVRKVQPAWGLTDQASHRLALLAMHQMGLVIAGQNARYTTAQTPEDIAHSIKIGHIPVWQPYAMQHHDPAIPADWTATSDALAARLAERLGATSVALVKSCTINAGVTLAALASLGIVDPVFADIVTRARLAWHVYGANDEPALAASLGIDHAP